MSRHDTPPTDKQLALCEKLMDLGATQEELNEYHASIDAADKFIKKWNHLLRRKATLDNISIRVRADEWGGIPNC